MKRIEGSVTGLAVLLLGFWVLAVGESLGQGSAYVAPLPPKDPCGGLTLPSDRRGGGEGSGSGAGPSTCVVPLQESPSEYEDPNEPNPPTNAWKIAASPEENCPDSKDPINIISGSVMVREVDVVVPCPLLDLSFIRRYNSNLTYGHPLGHRWTHSYNWTLSEYKSSGEGGEFGDWIVLRAVANPWQTPYNGEFHWFEKQEDGSYEVAAGVPYRLERLQGADGYQVSVPGGIDYLFDTNGILQKIEHAAGQSVTMSYTNSYPSNLLTRAEHSNGQYLEFTYTSSNIVQIATPSTNLSVSFSYDGNGDLTNVVRHTARGEFSTTYTYNQ